MKRPFPTEALPPAGTAEALPAHLHFQAEALLPVENLRVGDQSPAPARSKIPAFWSFYVSHQPFFSGARHRRPGPGLAPGRSALALAGAAESDPGPGRCLYGLHWRWQHDRAGLQAEYRHPSRFALLALLPITTIIIGLLLLLALRPLALALIGLGIGGQLLFVALRVAPLWQGNFCEEAVVPTFYLPTVAASFTSAAALGVLDCPDYGRLFLGAGLLAWIIYEPILLQRLRRFAAAPELRPSLGIVLAPAFVGLNAHFTLNGGAVDLLALLLLGYGLLQGLFLARNFRWLSNGQFSLGLWSFSFGLAALAGAALVLIQRQALPALGWTLFCTANALLALLLGRSLLRLRS